MSTSYFYCQIEKNALNASILTRLEEYADRAKQQTYVVDRPLAESKYAYSYRNSFVVLVPNYKISFIDYGSDEDGFDEYVEDFVEDLGSISDKYRYKDVIGRPRQWRDELITTVHLEDIDDDLQSYFNRNSLQGGEKRKKCELLISLLTGSINDIEKVKAGVPENLLDKIKQKIILFDGDQTRFVYQRPDKKRITIQGLSGTGKTELLLHKLKEIYVEHPDTKVIFTCHNKILADSMRRRIPEFFNFMKVEEQIQWDKRLWCVNSWGAETRPDSGAYSYICHFYGIQFLRFSYSVNFAFACKKAIEDIKQAANNKFAFDYMLVDESQDFPPEFFELCELVTKNTVYVAGDIFQSIFDDSVIGEIQPDFLLSKCYRTDPRTLMFAHALGMGLFEYPKLRWLEDNEWKACGYVVNRSDNVYELSREPLRRFEDLAQEGFTSIELETTGSEEGKDPESRVIEIIARIREENPTVLADDIGVIFIDNAKSTYLTADRLVFSINREFGWSVNKAYESKQRVPDTLFVSNKNNVKGLEFPFVICVANRVHSSRSYRNALYMMLTRSFLRTYLLISEESNASLIASINEGLLTIKQEGVLRITPPSDKEKQDIVTAITYVRENVSFYDFVMKIFDDLDVLPIFRTSLFEVVQKTVGESFDEEQVFEVAEFNYRKMNKGA